MHSAAQPLAKVFSAVVRQKESLAPSTVALTFEVVSSETCRCSFSPGQWVDCFIPDVKEIGGFSLTSSPLELPFLGLAVKLTDHPPTIASHAAKVGDVWNMRVGGNFKLVEAYDCLFISGGIGVTPFVSMVKHMRLQQSSRKRVLLHSAPSVDELVFHHQLLEEECLSDEFFSYLPCVSRALERRALMGKRLEPRRIDESDIESALSGFTTPPYCFVCGPPDMTTSIVAMLKEQEVKNNMIRFEKWW